MCAVKLGQLDFGQMDAMAEVVTADARRRTLFDDAFVMPPGFDVGKFERGELFFVTGRKGAGKTAFLRHLHANMAEDVKGASSFIVFRDDIRAREKEDIFTKSGISIRDNPTPDPKRSDVVDGWLMYIYLELARIFENNREIVKTADRLNEYLDLAASFRGKEHASTWKRILAALEKIDVRGIRLRSSSVPASVPEVLKAFADILGGIGFKEGKKAYILFDELHYSVTVTNKNEQDTILVRDLIAAVGRFNRQCIQKSIPVHVLCAVRSEVIQSVFGAAHELGKTTSADGAEIVWHKRGARRTDEHPLIALVESRIRACEKNAGAEPSKDVWTTYFPDKVNGSFIKAFIYANTWARPRDLVSLLGTAAKNSPNRTKLDAVALNSTAAEHSKYSWDERVAELAVTYDEDEIALIKSTIVEIGRDFTANEFATVLSRKSGSSQVGNKSARGVLRDLYNLGVIGQRPAERTFRWAHEGWREVNFDHAFRLHRSLYAEFVTDKVTEEALQGDDGD